MTMNSLENKNILMSIFCGSEPDEEFVPGPYFVSLSISKLIKLIILKYLNML